MQKTIRRGLAAALCALLLSGCGSSQANNKPKDTAEEDLPYGATLVLDNQKHKITVQYDSRFIKEESLDTLVDYYYAIQSKDAALFNKVQYPLMHDYLLGDMLKGEYTDEDIIENTYKTIRDYVGTDFDFSMIDITGCIVNDGFQASQNVVTLLDDLAESKNLSKPSEKISDFYELTITRYFTEKGSGVRSETDKSAAGETLFLFCCDGQWYVMYN